MGKPGNNPATGLGLLHAVLSDSSIGAEQGSSPGLVLSQMRAFGLGTAPMLPGIGLAGKAFGRGHPLLLRSNENKYSMEKSRFLAAITASWVFRIENWPLLGIIAPP